MTSTILAKKYGIVNSTSEYLEILKDEEVDLVLVTTQHHMHAKMTIEAINSGKNVFVEKPLALNKNELNEILGLSTFASWGPLGPQASLFPVF